MIKHSIFLIALHLVCIAFPTLATERIDFDREVAPILAANCLECHNASISESKLDLSSRKTTALGGESGKVIAAGNSTGSLLWQRVSSNEMPPKHPLDEFEKRTLQSWIDGGATWGTDPIDPFRFSTSKRAGYDWWSLQPLVRVDVPIQKTDQSANFTRNEIDHFVLEKLGKKQLSPSPRADARTLVRRAYYDLLGLPAPIEVIESFELDSSQRAWESLVDRLLASPHYGERWSRHWLDVARFGETHGYEYNEAREGTWHYRDWVIRSLNDDLPYDEFVRLQIAGDLIKPDAMDGVAATGFLVAGIHNTIVGQSPNMKKSARYDELEEIAGVVGQTFLGLTINCARCHDHKFDPITTKEYYQFIAALDGVQHGTRDVNSATSNQRVFAIVARDPTPMRILLRGDVTRPDREVEPSGLLAVRSVDSAFGITSKANDRQRRIKLADWITDSENGPFHRVMVNRVWHYHFGQGLVSTPNDLGFNGDRPSHPKLLEWLATWFRDHGYSIKKLHRMIMTSATYQQSSQTADNSVSATAQKVDASNRLLWRQNPRRVDSESLRDSMLSVADKLNPKQFGPGFIDVRTDKTGPAYYYVSINPQGNEFDRRTIYRWQARGERSSLLETFDCPDPSTTSPKRNTTTTPAQALSQWNHPFVLRVADEIGRKVVAATPKAEPQHRAKTAWRMTLRRSPDADELKWSTELLREHDVKLLCRVLLNSNEFIWIE